MSGLTFEIYSDSIVKFKSQILSDDNKNPMQNNNETKRDTLINLNLCLNSEFMSSVTFCAIKRKTHVYIPASRKSPKGIDIAISIIIANIFNVLQSKLRLCVPRNKRFLRGSSSRYIPKGVTYYSFTKALDAMEKAGLIVQRVTRGEHRHVADVTTGEVRTIRQATTIEPTPFLLSLLASPSDSTGLTDSTTGGVGEGFDREPYEIGLPPTRIADGAEVIHLRDKPDGKSVPVEYDDTPETIAMREEVERINAHLKRYRCKHVGSLITEYVPDDPYLVRIFNNADWRQGGRLYGYWPQSIKAEDRHKLRIQGEPLADMDFASCAVGLLHFHDGIEFDPDTDPFTIPGFEEHRDTIKRASYAILNSPRRLTGYPDGFSKEERSKLSWKKLNELIHEYIPIISRHAYTGIGLKLSYHESNIIINVMMALINNEVSFVPMHDGIMVPESQAELTKKLMHECYTNYTGQNINVKPKPFKVNKEN